MINIPCKCGATLMSFYDQEQRKSVYVRQGAVHIQGKWGFMLHYCKHIKPESPTLLFQDNGIPIISREEYAVWKEHHLTNQAKLRSYKYLECKTND